MEKNRQVYIKSGDDFDISNNTAFETSEYLPKGTYNLTFIMNRGWVLQRIKDFKLPKNLYGNLERRSNKILTTYKDRLLSNKSTGVALLGNKGSGKTLLAKKVALDSNLPVVVVNKEFTDDSFKEVINGLGECVVIFDEFEKVYRNSQEQEALLTLLDGVLSPRALFFIIANNQNSVSYYLKNRPNRIYYSFEYKGLDKETIESYCLKNLNNSSETIEVLAVAGMFEDFNFDMLQSLVEEMNRYKISASEAVEDLNIRTSFSGSREVYSVKMFDLLEEKFLPIDEEYKTIPTNPLVRNYSFGHHFEKNTVRLIETNELTLCEEDLIENADYIEVETGANSFKHYNPKTQTYVFENQRLRVIIKKEDSITGIYDYRNYSRFDFEGE